MEQTERITEMERRMESAAKAVMELSAALDNYEEAQEAIAALDGKRTESPHTKIF